MLIYTFTNECGEKIMLYRVPYVFVGWYSLCFFFSILLFIPFTTSFLPISFRISTSLVKSFAVSILQQTNTASVGFFSVEKVLTSSAVKSIFPAIVFQSPPRRDSTFNFLHTSWYTSDLRSPIADEGKEWSNSKKQLCLALSKLTKNGCLYRVLRKSLIIAKISQKMWFSPSSNWYIHGLMF